MTRQSYGSQTLPERRSGPRAPLGVPAWIKAPELDIECRAIDLSWTGMLLLTGVNAQPGLAMQVSVHLPQINRVEHARASLMREARYGETVAWGVQFRDLSPAVGSRFRVFVHRTLRGQYQPLDVAAPQESAALRSSPPRPQCVRPAVTAAQAQGTAKAFDEELAAYLSSSDSSLRALYRDAVAELGATSDRERKRRRRRRRFWLF